MYDNFRGTSTLNPSTLERAHTLSFEDAVAGISALVISGPAGFEGYSRIFEPPVSTTTISFEDMPFGDYGIRAVDAAGNEPVAPFRIVELGVSVSTQDCVMHGFELTSTPEEFSEKFGVRLAVKTQSSIPIEKVSLYGLGYGGNTPTLIQSVPGGEAGETVYFDTGINPEIFYSTNDYIAQVWDTGGGGRTVVFGVRKYLDEIPAFEGSFNNTYYNGNWIALQSGAKQGSFVSSAVDLKGIPGFVSGAVYNQFPYNKEFNSLSPSLLAFVQGSSDKYYGLPVGNYQDIGSVEAHLITSDNSDMSGGAESFMIRRHHFAVQDPTNYENSGSTCSYAGFNQGYWYCYTETPVAAAILPLKRYVQTRLDFNIAAPGSILYGACAAVDGSTCEEGHGFTLEGALFNNYYTGASIVPVNYYPLSDNAILPGKNVTVPLGSGVYADFDSIDSVGSLGFSVETGESLPGYIAVPAGHAYNLNSDLSFTGATLTFPYDAAGLTAAQQGQIKVLRVLDQAKGLYEELPTTFPGDNKVSARITAFGKFMVAAPAYGTPHPVSAGSMGGGAELEFVSNTPVTHESVADSSVYSGIMYRNLELNGMAPVGNIYYIGPDNTPLTPAGAIKMRYDKAAVAALGLPESEIGLYEFTADGSLLFKLPRQTVNTETGEIIAEVPKLYSLFGVLGRSYQPRPMDIMLPETLLEYDGAGHTAGPYL